MHLNVSSEKLWPFCLGLNVLSLPWVTTIRRGTAWTDKKGFQIYNIFQVHCTSNQHFIPLFTNKIVKQLAFQIIRCIGRFYIVVTIWDTVFMIFRVLFSLILSTQKVNLCSMKIHCSETNYSALRTINIVLNIDYTFLSVNCFFLNK